MKKLLTIAVLSVAGVSFNASATLESTKSYKFVGDRSYSGFCKAALTDNVDLFKRSLRSKVGVISSSTQGVLDIVLNEKSVQCSGMGLVEFTEKRNAKQLTEFIAQSKI